MKLENTKAQMRKGVLEYCILSILKNGEAYPSDILLKLKKSKLRPKSKSNIVRIITELLKKYVLKDFAVQTKKDLFIKKYLIN